MIKNILFKFGCSHYEKLTVSTEDNPVTVLIGPNHSGKSHTLKEIELLCKRQQSSTIVDSIETHPLSPDDTKKAINSIVEGAHRSSLKSKMKNKSPDLYPYLLAYKTVKFDGKTRLSAPFQQPMGDLISPKFSNSLQILFQDESKKEELNRIVYDAFHQYLVIDPTNGGSLRLRLSSEKPDSSIERSLTKEAIAFHKKLDLVENSSDGVKAFIGTIIEIIAGDPIVLLIDEPEAFLHPSLAFKLGKYLSSIAIDSNKKIFAATHSSHFLMGCIQSKTSINIVRLTYDKKKSTARQLSANNLRIFANDPLLRSTKALAGLFYQSVVVTEGNSDRAFYEAINELMIESSNNHKSKHEGIHHCLFIDAHNWQTISKIVKPLRELGIPTSAIVDLDVIKSEGKNWKNFLSCGFFDDVMQETLCHTRGLLKKELELNDNSESLKKFIGDLGDYGLFLVPVGELEDWLPNINKDFKKNQWIVKAFEEIENQGSNIINNNISDFMNKISQWCYRAERKGMPNKNKNHKQ